MLLTGDTGDRIFLGSMLAVPDGNEDGGCLVPSSHNSVLGVRPYGIHSHIELMYVYHVEPRRLHRLPLFVRGVGYCPRGRACTISVLCQKVCTAYSAFGNRTVNIHWHGGVEAALSVLQYPYCTTWYIVFEVLIDAWVHAWVVYTLLLKRNPGQSSPGWHQQALRCHGVHYITVKGPPTWEGPSPADGLVFLILGAGKYSSWQWQMQILQCMNIVVIQCLWLVTWLIIQVDFCFLMWAIDRVLGHFCLTGFSGYDIFGRRTSESTSGL